LKPESGFIEVDVPVDTTRFYDEMKADGWGGVSKQTLQGVLLDLEGYFVGNVQNGELILLPLNGITQLRSSLKHIDREFNDKKEMTRLENNANRTNGHDIQVVQMTVRSTTDNAPRLGGALLARKKVDEETYQVLTWNDLNDESTKKIREELLESNENLKVELTPLTTNEEHIDLLVKETLV
jgi:DNA-directed RNA polymerase-3 subunit RPC5